MRDTVSRRMDSIYKEVFDFCDKEGLIKKLEDSFLIPEEERFAKMSIDKHGLAVLDAVHCLYDKSRTEFFKKEIKKYVSKGEVVIEAGIGTGILSFYAASAGARVYGCELNSKALVLAEKIKSHLESKGLIPKNSIQFFLHDATTFIPPEKADVLISENIYTGMFFEYQVQIMKHLSKYLNKNARIIPQEMSSHFKLCHINSNDKQKTNKELIIPSKESGIKVTSMSLSKSYLYDDIKFNHISKTKVNFKHKIPITHNGKINSICISSDVILPSSKIIKTKDTTFLNNEIYLVVKPEISVKKGDTVSFAISYKYGQKSKEAKIILNKK